MTVLRRFFKPMIRTAGVAGAVLFASCAQIGKASPDTTTALIAQVAQLREQVAYLSDRQQIHDVYLHYMRGFDRNDVDLMRTAFWPDVQINYGAQSNSFDEFVTRHLNEHVQDLAHWMHLITNESVDIHGDVAHVETYVVRLSSNKKDRKSMFIAGRYIDRLDRRNGEWRIAVREFVPVFRTETENSIDPGIASDKQSRTTCGWGTLDKHDPSYLRPLTARTDEKIGPACAK